jgi:hypothetical protein
MSEWRSSERLAQTWIQTFAGGILTYYYSPTSRVDVEAVSVMYNEVTGRLQQETILSWFSPTFLW